MPFIVLFALLVMLGPLAGPARAEPALPAAGRFASFESGQVRPVELSPDGKRLYVLNTPDNRLDIYRIKNGVPRYRRSVRVGLEPVALASRNNREVWVVNHLSDSVSIVDVQARPPRVRRTLLVGDEPRDIVFAGPGRARAFITAAHRGQNVPFDPQPFTPGVGRADVWVFDAAEPGNGLGGTPLSILSLFGDTLRPLAVSPDGSRVYAGVFNSGNRTTVLQADIAGGGLKKPGPGADSVGNKAPLTGLIVRYDGAHWIDNGDPDSGQASRAWDERVRFELPDYDVFEGHGNLVTLNHQEPAVLSYVVHVMDHWLTRGADGWRLDAAYAVAPAFWREVAVLFPDYARIRASLRDNGRRYFEF